MQQTLTQEEQIMLDKHLDICPDCRQMADQMLAEKGERKGGLQPKLSLAEKEELRKQVLARIKEIEPNLRP